MSANAILKQANEDSSPEWEKIKGWVGSHEPQKKHPIHQLIEREQNKTKGYDEGGAAGDPLTSDPESMRLLEPQGAGLIAPSASTARPTPLPPPMAPRPPVMAPRPPVAPPQAPIGTPPAAPTGAPYESAAAKALGTDPEALKAFLTKTMTPTGGEMIGRAGATMGDAFSRAGGSESNYLDQFNQNTQKNKENMAGIPEKVSALGKEKYSLEEQMQAKDPASPFSKVTQNANRQLLKSMGASDQDISSMPATAINDVVGHQVTLQDALARIRQEGAYQKGMLGIQEEAQKTRGAEAATHAAEAKKGALEKIAGGSPIPFVGPSHKEKQAAISKLGELGGIGSGNEVQRTTKDGRTAIFDADTKQFIRYADE